MPELKALTKKYPSSKLALISFSADSDQQGFIRERIVGLNPQLTAVGGLKDTLQTLLPAD